MRAYGFFIRNMEPSRVAQMLGRDMYREGEDKFSIDSMYAACENSGKEYELARGTKKKKTRAELETEEALDEEFEF